MSSYAHALGRAARQRPVWSKKLKWFELLRFVNQPSRDQLRCARLTLRSWSSGGNILRRGIMDWARMLAYITGTVDQELLLRNEYLVIENRILKAQLKGREHLAVHTRQLLSNRVFKSYDDIVALCCEAWNKLIDQPWKIMSIGRRKWAHGY